MPTMKNPSLSYKKLAFEYHALPLSDLVENVDAYHEAFKKQYRHRMSEMEMLQGVVTEADGADSVKIRDLINKDQFDTDPQEFHKSLQSVKKGSEYLSQYSIGELSKMKTFKVIGYNIGFTIKDGDIVSVHNGTNNGGIVGALIEAAKRHGGKQLDHFDGFLTGIYSQHGFHVTNVQEWDDQYAPSDWKYQPININDKNASVYANGWKRGPKEGTPEWEAKAQQYRDGKPDIIYRHL